MFGYESWIAHNIVHDILQVSDVSAKWIPRHLTAELKTRGDAWWAIAPLNLKVIALYNKLSPEMKHWSTTLWCFLFPLVFSQTGLLFCLPSTEAKLLIESFAWNFILGDFSVIPPPPPPSYIFNLVYTQLWNFILKFLFLLSLDFWT